MVVVIFNNLEQVEDLRTESWHSKQGVEAKVVELLIAGLIDGFGKLKEKNLELEERIQELDLGLAFLAGKLTDVDEKILAHLDSNESQAAYKCDSRAENAVAIFCS